MANGKSIWDKQEVVALMGKNDRGDYIQISKVSKGDNDYVDIRQLFTPDGTLKPIPTKKGIVIHMEMLPEVVEYLNAIVEEDGGDE